MFKSLALLTALVVATATMAKADQISITGADSYNTTTQMITFSGQGDVTGSTGIFSYLPPCKACVNLPGAALNYGSFTGPYNLFDVFEGSNNLLVQLESITNVEDADGSGFNSLTIFGNATLFLNNGGVSTATPGVLVLTTQGPSGEEVNVSFSATTSPVPEPASLALFGSGLLGIVGLARRKFNV